MAAAISAFFLPGYAWVLISGLSSRINRVEQTTLAFVISLVLLSLLTAGLSLVTQQYLHFSLIISIVGSLAVLSLYTLKNRPGPIHYPAIKSLQAASVMHADLRHFSGNSVLVRTLLSDRGSS